VAPVATPDTYLLVNVLHDRDDDVVRLASGDRAHIMD
jgi:hypothetical protein